ncbi:hypothetical protein ACLIBG_02805 [Virgibacillus sp. W0181]|uniref:hypothetical protein n=1 Tax=Virgibacillus sp. W0181 TaxID=3391581 RepID=UPI003F46D11C
MHILVENCFHWIGFHLIDQLLEEGYRVDGINAHNSNETDHFLLFLGRNSNFTLLKDVPPDKTYDAVFTIGSPYDKVSYKRRFEICRDHTTVNESESKVIIEQPLLFGEWMPMNEKGFYYKNEFVPFISDCFLQEAIYIRKFVRSLIQLMHTDRLPNRLTIKSAQSPESSSILENNIYLYDNIRIDDKHQLLEHYERYIDYYNILYGD